MRRQLCDQRLSARRGLTLLEVVVLLLALGLLVALLMPAMRSSKVASRRLQCLNNLKQLGTAVINYQVNADDKYPLLSGYSHKESTTSYGWPVHLLPLLDSAALARQIRDAPDAVIAPSTGIPKLALRFYTCPDDSNNFRVEGGLSYAANAGYMTSAVWGDPGADAGPGRPTFHTVGTLALGDVAEFDERVARHFATGIFWRSVTAPTDAMDPENSRQEHPRMTGDYVSRHDGLTNTLLFAENVQSRNWASANVNDIGFGLSVKTLDSTGEPDHSNPTGRIGAAGEPLALRPGWSLAGPGGNDAGLNANLRAKPGHAPRPSSDHAGGVINVSFADGRAIAISESIDPTVYARLLTPAGEAYGQEKVDPIPIE